MARSRTRTPRFARNNLSGAMKSASSRAKSKGAPAEDWRKAAERVLGPRTSVGQDGPYDSVLYPGGVRPQGGAADDELRVVGKGDVDPGFRMGDWSHPSPGVGLGPARRWPAEPNNVSNLSDGLQGEPLSPANREQMGGPDQPTANANYHEFVQAHGGKSTARLGGLFSQNTGRRLTPKMRRAIMNAAATPR